MAKIGILTLFALGNFLPYDGNCESFDVMFVQKKNIRLHRNCNNLENIYSATKVDCAVLCAKHSGCNSANFKFRESECKLKFCEKISSDTVQQKKTLFFLFNFSRILIKY